MKGKKDEGGGMNEDLPVGWTMARVGQLGEVQLGKMLDRAKNSGTPAPYLRNINVRWFGFDLTDLKTVLVSPDEQERFSVLDGDLFICEGGEPGRAGVWRNGKSDLVYQKALHRFRTNGSILPDLLMYRFRLDAEVGSLHQSFSGSTIKHFTKESLVKYQIPLAPLSEQKRIADKLEALLGRVDACRTRLDRVPALLKRFRQSVLSAATSGKLTEDWRGENPHGSESMPPMHEIETDELEELPSGWIWSCPQKIRNAERYSLAIGPFGSNLKVSDYQEAGVPLVFVREIRSRSFGGAKTKYVTTEKAEELKAHSASGGDLLITKMGDPPGDVAIYPIASPRAIITADCIKLRVDPTKADTTFISYVIESPQTRARLLDIVAGVAQQKISLERFRDFPIQLAPIPEQQEIVRRVEALFAFADRIEARLSAAQTTVARLTPATLAKAFRGELVPQDPDDEPAAALLARLQKQTVNLTPKRRSRIVST